MRAKITATLAFLKQRGARLIAAAKSFAPDATTVAGLTLVVYGVAQIYVPAAYILAGSGIAAIGVLFEKRP